MYLAQYNRIKDVDELRANDYRQNWRYYYEIAVSIKEEEETENRAQAWRPMYKNDARQL